MEIRTLKQAVLKNKKVLLRIDLNVPFDDLMNITDDSRLMSHVPTIKYILENEGMPIIVSHIGRPKGKPEARFSHRHVLNRLEKLCEAKIKFCESTIGKKASDSANSLKNGEILLLENARFYPEEKSGDETFCFNLASLADVFVMDSFASAHRKDCSVSGVAKCLPAYGGLLVEREINALDRLIDNIERPYIAIIGGLKIADKIGVLENLIKKVDVLLIGGAMAFTFLAAKGLETGQSIVERTCFENVKKIMLYAAAEKVKIMLPSGFYGLEHGNRVHYETGKIPSDFNGFDIDEKTVADFSNELKDAKTVVWNGPLGVFEEKGFEIGTFSIARSITETKAFRAAGGGDTSAAIKLSGCLEKFSHVSVGGGAFIEYLAGNTLPGLENIMVR